MFEGPEKKFQRHIFEYLIREHKYAVTETAGFQDCFFCFNAIILVMKSVVISVSNGL